MTVTVVPLSNKKLCDRESWWSNLGTKLGGIGAALPDRLGFTDHPCDVDGLVDAGLGDSYGGSETGCSLGAKGPVQ